jgi:hypothetical protein
VSRLGVVKRRREFDPVLMVFVLVMQGGTAEAGRIAAAIREYYNRGGSEVARSAHSRWFDAEFLALMEELTRRTTSYVLSMPLHLPGVLSGRRDWRVFDSTTVRLPDELAGVYTGTGKYAALKVHKELSLGLENVVSWHITEARSHDAPQLVVDESRRGTGLIVDLGYVSHELIRKCHEHDVHLVIRLKGGWKLHLDDTVQASVVCDWTASETLLERWDGAPLPKTLGEPLDVDVRMGPKNDPVRARLINIETPDGWHAYLTTVPRETHDADAVAFLYQLRWGVELQNKLAKTGCQLDEITAKRPVAVQILVHASMIASMLANALAHLGHLSMGAIGETVVRLKSPPLHAMLVWKTLVVGAGRIAELLSQPSTTDKDWEFTARRLHHGGQDPNWKNSPSPIDDAKGRNKEGRAYWKRRPTPEKTPRKQHSLK